MQIKKKPPVKEALIINKISMNLKKQWRLM
jgi:hypothetical protein